MIQFYVYKLIDINGNIFYIGKGMKKDKYDRLNYHKNYWHHNCNKKLSNKIKKLNGVFDSEIVKISDDEQECLKLEIELIKEIGLNNLCNLTKGGEGISGYSHTQTTKNKMSKLALNQNRIKISLKNLKKATLKNIGKRKLGKYHNQIIELYKTKSICQLCDILHVDFKQLKRYLIEKNLYIRNKNRPKISEETRKKLSIVKLNNSLSKPVIQFDKEGNKIQEFPSASEASNFIKGVRKYGNYICQCCNGNRKTAFGYKWKYK